MNITICTQLSAECFFIFSQFVSDICGVAIEVVEGDILCINKDGEIARSEFEPKLYRSKYLSWYGDDEPYYGVHEEMLLAYCGCYGVDSSDVELLLEYGYTCDEIEDMLADHALLHETLQAIKFEEDYTNFLVEV